jgi:CRISPR/Cas system-associated endonuclease Cas1
MTRSLYLDQHGTKVGFQAGQLHLGPLEIDAVDIPINHLEYVVVLSHDAPCALLKNGIPTVISSSHGGCIGALSGLPGNQMQRRMAQYDAKRNSQAQLNITKAMANAKLRSQFRLLHHWRVVKPVKSSRSAASEG